MGARIEMDEEPQTALPRPEVDPLVLQRQRRRLFSELLGVELEGARLDHYELLHELGRGAMGVVYAAHDTKLDRKVAIKKLADDDPTLRSRLVAEARAMAKLNHPNVVPVHEIGEVEGAAFIVMAHVEGLPLRRWLTAQRRSLAEILAVFRDAGRGLAAVHAKGLVHRDFKPDNVMVGEDGRARVMDFGVARLDDPATREPTDEPSPAPIESGDLTQTGALIGTPAYMAPEQLRGLDALPASDQFGFCVALFEAVHGIRPFEADSLPGLLAAIEDPRRERSQGPRASEVPAWLQTVLARGLSVAADDRFASMDALLDALVTGEGEREAPAFVYLAHRGADSLAVLALATALLERGLRSYFAPWEDPSDEPHDAVLERAPALLICQGPGAWPAANEGDELRAAIEDRLGADDPRAWVVTLPDADLDQLPSTWTSLPRLAADAETVGAALGVIEDRSSWQAEEAARAGLPPEQLCPYQGPRALTERDARWMFGRERETAALVARLAQADSRFTCVTGASGVGKSSLVFAGLCPLVRAGVLDPDKTWTIATMRPGPEPCAALARALSTVAPALELDEAALVQEAGVLARTLRTRRDPKRALLLVVDQLEELFSEAGLTPQREPPSAARAFVDNLVRAARGDTGLYVVATLRADFIDRCLDIHPLARVLQAGTFTLAPMRAAQLRAAIELPLRRVGYTIAPALLAELVAAASDRAERLPLLQHVLVDSWTRRERDARLLDDTAYLEGGGLEGALTLGADHALARLRDELGPAGERAVRRIMTRLVRPGRRERGDTRRRAVRAELVDDDTSARVLDALVGDARILIAVESEGRERFELAHDVLVREWAPLIAWLDAERDALRLREELRAAAERFTTHDEDPEWLWGRSRIDEARRVLADGSVELLDEERRFLEHSQVQTRRRERRVRLGLVGAFAVLVGLLGFALRLAALNQDQASENRALAQARDDAQARADDGVNAQKGLRATMLANESLDVEALLLAIEALGDYELDAGRPPPAHAYEGVLAALQMDTILGPRARLDGQGHKLVDVVFSPDGHKLASAGFDGRALLIDARSGEIQATLDGHEDALTALAFSPDGRLIATASWDDSIRLWNTHSGELEAVLRGHEDDVLSVAFSPSGTRLASASADASVRLWDPSSGAALAQLEDHTGAVTALAFSPDGETLASASHDTTARLWDMASGTLRHTLEGHTSRLFSLAFSPDGATLVSCGYEPTLRRWSVADGTALESLDGHRSSVVALAFAPDGETLASASYDDSARLWDLDSGQTLVRFEGHTDDVLDLSFSPDGAQLVTGSADGSARVWDTATGRVLAHLDGHEGPVLAVAASPSASAFATASADGSGLLWTPSTPTWTAEFDAHGGPVSALVHGPSGQLASASHDGSVRLWSPSNAPEPTLLRDHRDAVLALAMSPDGTTLASAGRDSDVRLWDTESGQLIARFEGHHSHVVALAFSPDGHKLASASYDASVRLWGTQSHTLLDTLEGHHSYVTALAFAPSAPTLASASHDTSVRLWDVELGQQRATLEGHHGYVVSLAFAPDGATLASGSWDHDLRLWDVSTASPLAVLSGHQAPITELLFDPGGARLISADADGELRLWDLGEDRQASASIRLGGHAAEVLALAGSPDGKLLVSASADDEVRVWDLASAGLLARLGAHRDDVLSLSFAPDGRSFVSGGADGLMRRWPTPATALDLACQRVAPYLVRERVADLCL